MEEDEDGMEILREMEKTDGIPGVSRARRKLKFDALLPTDDSMFDLDSDLKETRQGVSSASGSQLAKSAPNSKKRGRDENESDDLLSIIAERRKLQKIPSKTTSVVQLTTVTYYDIPPRDKDTIYVTSSAGRRIYAEIESEDEQLLSGLEIIKSSSSTSMLASAIANVKKLAEEEDRFNYFVQQQQAQASSENNTYVMEFSVCPSSTLCKLDSESSATSNESMLWVDKYAPKSFIDLLSEEKANRSVLSWLKEWDTIVFNKPVHQSKLKNALFNRMNWSSRNRAATNSPQKQSDNQSPSYKTVLICGPPGIGKTTLAHVIARHAGYQPIEFNASDDRTSSTFLPKVLDVIETQSAFMEGQKPKCLIIDEIDGVLGGEGKGAIAGLVKIIDEEAVGNRKGRPLKRPIICICNDPWAPALAKLRERAMILRLEPPPVANLVQRLQHICNKENIKVERNLLHALCELTNNDIRACLNTLQFMSRSSKTLTIDMLNSANIANKDIHTNLFDVWRSVFVKQQKSGIVQAIINSRRQKKTTDQDTILTAYDDSIPNSKSEADVLFAKVAHADVDRVLEGCFEHYLSVGYSDALLNKTVKATNAFEFASIMWNSMRSHQHFLLSSYLPVVAVAINLHCSVPRLNKQLTYPRAESQAKYKIESTMNVINAFLSGVAPRLYPFLSKRILIEEFLSLFLVIIAPKFTSVTASLMGESEQDHASILANIYLDYGLTFEEVNTDTTTQHGAHVYKLKPPIDENFSFEGVESAFAQTTDVQRQILLGQIQLTRYSRLDAIKAKLEDPAPADAVQAAPSVDTNNKDSDSKEVKEEEPVTVERDFFGRPIVRKKPVVVAQKQEVKPQAKPPPAVLYKFHEGFTNAVRRKVYMRDLL